MARMWALVVAWVVVVALGPKDAHGNAIEATFPTAMSLTDAKPLDETVRKHTETLKQVDVYLVGQDRMEDTIRTHTNAIQHITGQLKNRGEVLEWVTANKRSLDNLITELGSGQVVTLQAKVESLEQQLTEERTRNEGLKEQMENQTKLLAKQFEMVQRKTVAAVLSKPQDCLAWYNLGYTESEVYTIFPLGASHDGVQVWCDMTNGGGWTVFLSRQRQGQPTVDFTQTWQAYVDGFGTASGEYWLGNRYLHALTQDRQQVLRMGVQENTSGDTSISLANTRKFAEWTTFSVGDEASKFVLQADDVTPTSTLSNVLQDHNGQKFSTKDQDNDSKSTGSCTETKGGGGWWYNNCGAINPTAPEAHDSSWTDFGWIHMMIRG